LVPAVTTDWSAPYAQAQADIARGEMARAFAVLAPAQTDVTAPLPVVRLLASALRALRRNRDARPVLEHLTRLQPDSAIAEHNLAAALGDMGDAVAAEAAARRALTKGGDAPETWLVLGRALTAQSRLDEASSAFGQALARRPAYIDALRDLAQLIWMRTGDPIGAVGPVDQALVGSPMEAALVALKSAILLDIDSPESAYAALSSGLAAPPPVIALAAAAAAAEIDPALALRHAEEAFRGAPGDTRAANALSAAQIASGQAVDALLRLDAVIAARPLDQYALALRNVAWRVTGDDRALSSADYQRLCRPFSLGLDAEGLDRVASALDRLHPFAAQPLGQSIRSGVQAALDPRHAGDPDIDTVFRALEGPIERYIADMADHDDAMSLRAGSGHEIIGAWSVRLTAGGRHSDHIHPEGWVSSALYITTPQVDPTDPRAGWLRFGAVRLGVGLELPAEHWIEPRPGVVALFPSWMWHGTEPFRSQGVRMTIAFDVQPGWGLGIRE
jgi:tetratricopeptide (TPR) repeat protein